jgi:hypothetical protein
MDTSIWSNFTGFQEQNVLNQNFSDTQVKSSEEQKAIYEKVANACNPWYSPVFEEANSDTPTPTDATIVGVGVVEVVPVDLKEEKKTDVSTTNAQALTIPPIQLEKDDVLKAVLIGLGVVFVLKIIE